MSKSIVELDNKHCVDFLVLPPEVRNEIYLLVLYADSKETKGLPCRKFVQWDGLYNPYLVWVAPQASPETLKLVNSQRKFNSGAVFLKDPAIWQLNKQIRQEARSLYLKDRLSIELRGANDDAYKFHPAQVGLNHFKGWWHTLDEGTIRGIQTIEVRDFAEIVYPVLDNEPTTVDPITGDSEGESWACEIPVFQIRIGDEGHSLTVRTPLQLVVHQAQKITDWLEELVRRRRLKGQRDGFDGNDIYELVCWLRTDEDDIWSSYTMELDDQEVAVRFRFWGTVDTVVYLDTAPWFTVKKDWRHITAEVRLFDS